MPRRGIYLGPPKKGLVKVIQYRSRVTGRLVKEKEALRRIRIGKALTQRGKRPKKLFDRERYQYRVTELGQWETGLRLSGVKSVTKTISQKNLDTWDGMIKEAMGETNVFTEIPDARIIDFTITGKTKQGQIYTLKKSLDTRFVRRRGKLQDLSVAEIMSMLHLEGFRVDYPIQIVKWTGKYTRRYEAKSYTVLRDVKITIRVRK